MITKQTIEGMKEWLNEESGTPGGHYFLTHAEVQGVLDTVIALEESVKLQGHYAGLLNMHDGGERIAFVSVKQWEDRLKEISRKGR